MRERERQNDIAREWENESSTEWKPKRLSSCLTYITCRNYSGIFGSWPLKLPALIVNEARPPLILLTLPPILLLSAYALPCHKSIRVKFFGQSIKSITKSAIFSKSPAAMLSCLCHVEQKQLPVLRVASASCQLPVARSVRVAYTPRGTHAKDIVGKWINGKLKAIFCLPSRWEYVCMCVCVLGLSSWFNCACVWI